MSSRTDQFDRIVRSHASAVHRYSLFLLRDSWVADDVVQETFLRAWRNWDAFSRVNNHEAWLITVCRNVALDVMRRRRPTLPIDDKVEAQRFADWRIDDAVTYRLNRLSLEHREVVFFVDVLGYDYATLSEVLDVPVGTIRSRLSRARDQLRENEVRGVDMESA